MAECIVCNGTLELLLGEPCPLCDGFGVFCDEDDAVLADDNIPAQPLPSMEPDFEWNISADDIQRCRKSAEPFIQSKPFTFDGAPCDFEMRLFPCVRKSKESHRICELYIGPIFRQAESGIEGCWSECTIYNNTVTFDTLKSNSIECRSSTEFSMVKGSKTITAKLKNDCLIWSTGAVYKRSSQGWLKLQLHIKINDRSTFIKRARAVVMNRDGFVVDGGARVLSDTIVQVYVLQIGEENRLEWPLPTRYEKAKVLGTGGFGCVIQAFDKRENRYVAIKQIIGMIGTRGHAKLVLREISILSELEHANIVKLFGAFMDKRAGIDALYIVMEQCEMDLHQACRKSAGVTLNQARRLIHNIVVGCQHLHSRRVYHRDLKPGNILVNFSSCSVKLCDFNMARIVDEDKQASPKSGNSSGVPPMPTLTRHLTENVGTCHYKSPEICLRLRYSAKVDVWAVGCICVEVFSALNAYGREPNHQRLFRGRNAWPDPDGSADSRVGLLEEVVDMLGTPFDDPLFAQLPPSAQGQLQQRFPSKRPYRGLGHKVPAEAESKGLALVEALIRFFPEQRISMLDSLAHDFFIEIRREPPEKRDDEPCCLDVGYDEADLCTLEDVQAQLDMEIKKFSK